MRLPGLGLLGLGGGVETAGAVRWNRDCRDWAAELRLPGLGLLGLGGGVETAWIVRRS